MVFRLLQTKLLQRLWLVTMDIGDGLTTWRSIQNIVGGGHGRSMMIEAEKLLHDFGCPKINLQVRKDNLQAMAFYEKIGFTEDAVVSFGKRLISDD